MMGLVAYVIFFVAIAIHDPSLIQSGTKTWDPEPEPEPPVCMACGMPMIDDRDGMYGGWFCANNHRAIIIHPKDTMADPTPVLEGEKHG